MRKKTGYTAGNCYREALTALRLADYPAAARLFREAIDLERGNDKGTRKARCLSYYGLCLARQGHASQMAIEACRKALARSPEDPVLYLNLGHVYEDCGEQVAAIRTFQDGLKARPSHEGLRRELARIDRRSPPIVGLLPRDHPVNRWLGRTFRAPGGGRPRKTTG